MLLPGTAWMSMFFVSALLLLIALCLGTTDALGNPRFGTTLDNIVGIFNPTYFRVIVRSLVFAVAASVICLLIAYLVAYAIARHGGRYKNALVALLVVPFFANYLVRMFGWQTLLSDESMLMTRLRDLGAREFPHPRHRACGDRWPGLRLRRLHDPADLRVPGTHGRLAHRGRA